MAFNIMGTPGVGHGLSYRTIPVNHSSQSHGLWDPSNNLGYGIGRIFRKTFDRKAALYHRNL